MYSIPRCCSYSYRCYMPQNIQGVRLSVARQRETGPSCRYTQNTRKNNNNTVNRRHHTPHIGVAARLGDDTTIGHGAGRP